MATSGVHVWSSGSCTGAVLHWHVVLHATMFSGKRFCTGDRACAECDDVFQKITPAGHNSSQYSVIQAWTGQRPESARKRRSFRAICELLLSRRDRGLVASSSVSRV